MAREKTRNINKSAIVAAGFAVLAESGLGGLTVRAVAGKLAVQAPALYWHVRNKQDLLDEMSTELWRRILTQADLAVDTRDWREGLRIFAHAIRRTLLSVRDGARIFGGAYMTDDSLLTGQEEALAAFIAQGFDLRGAALAWRLVYNFTLGFCIEEQDVRQRADRYDVDLRDRRIDAATRPLSAQIGRVLFADPGANFDELLEASIDAAGQFRSA